MGRFAPAARGGCRRDRAARPDAPAISRSTRWCCRPAFRICCRKPHPAAARARAAGVPILSDAELLFQAVRRAGVAARFVGITGTNGKSTTTALLAHILDVAGVPVAAGGNLGTGGAGLCRCCRTTASMCWRCRPTCWSDSPRSASMPRRCSISAPTTWIATATWQAMSRPSGRSSPARRPATPRWSASMMPPRARWRRGCAGAGGQGRRAISGRAF